MICDKCFKDMILITTGAGSYWLCKSCNHIIIIK